MAYSTQADQYEIYTESELIRLTDDDNTGSVIAARVTAAIAKADTLIDSYCRAQHTVPFTSPPAMIVDLSIFFTSYYLWKRRRKAQVDEERELAYRNNMTILKDINSGKILINDANSFRNTGQTVCSNKSSSSKVYTSTQLGKY